MQTNHASLWGASVAIIIIYGLILYGLHPFKHKCLNPYQNMVNTHHNSHGPSGGSNTGDISYTIMFKYLSPIHNKQLLAQCKFHFEGCIKHHESMSINSTKFNILIQIPLEDLVYLIPKKYSLEIARLHEVPVGSHFTKKAIQTACLKHHCQQCENYISVFSLVIPTNKNNTHKIERIREQTRVRVQRHREKL